MEKVIIKVKKYKFYTPGKNTLISETVIFNRNEHLLDCLDYIDEYAKKNSLIDFDLVDLPYPKVVTEVLIEGEVIASNYYIDPKDNNYEAR